MTTTLFDTHLSSLSSQKMCVQRRAIIPVRASCEGFQVKASIMPLVGVKLSTIMARAHPLRKLLRIAPCRSATTEDIQVETELIEEDASQFQNAIEALLKSIQVDSIIEERNFTSLCSLPIIERMEKTLESVRGNFSTVRTGRASPSLLDRVEVEYYGTDVILKSIAQISAPDGSSILVQPFDKSSLGAIEKAISKSDIGLTPNNDGSAIRLNVPQLTTDRRKELLKSVSKLTEEGKVAIRNIRRDTIKSYEKLEKEKKISEDKVKDLSEEIQKITDDYVKKIDALFKQKEKELMTV